MLPRASGAVDELTAQAALNDELDGIPKHPVNEHVESPGGGEQSITVALKELRHSIVCATPAMQLAPEPRRSIDPTRRPQILSP